MNVLEKILEEIKEVEKKFVVGHEVLFALGATGIATEIEEIIRSHMDEAENDGWIPVEERLPEEKGDITKDFNLFKESLYLITDGTSVTIAPFDGGYFRCCDDYAPYTDAIAWKPLPEPYKPVENQRNRMEER